MARSAATRDVTEPGNPGLISHILLVETADADLSSLSQRLERQKLRVEVSQTSMQTCRLLSETSYDLVVAGPRLDQLSLDCIGTKTGRQQSEIQVLLSLISPLYQARDVTDFLP